MMPIVWIVVGVVLLGVLGVLGYGLFGQAARVRHALREAQTGLAPQAAQLTQGIQKARALRMQDGADTTRGHGRHA